MKKEDIIAFIQESPARTSAAMLAASESFDNAAEAYPDQLPAIIGWMLGTAVDYLYHAGYCRQDIINKVDKSLSVAATMTMNDELEQALKDRASQGSS